MKAIIAGSPKDIACADSACGPTTGGTTVSLTVHLDAAPYDRLRVRLLDEHNVATAPLPAIEDGEQNKKRTRLAKLFFSLETSIFNLPETQRQNQSTKYQKHGPFVIRLLKKGDSRHQTAHALLKHRRMHIL